MNVVVAVISVRKCVVLTCLWLFAVNALAVDVCEAESAYLEQLAAQETVHRIVDFSCFIPVENVPSDPLIVDIRTAQAFEKVRIKNSLNIHSRELLHSPGFKSRPVLIVDDGFSRTAPAHLCHQAREAGFNELHILLGGLAAWHTSGRELEGSAHHISELHSVDYRTLFTEIHTQRASLALAESTLNQLGLMAELSLRTTSFPSTSDLLSELPPRLRRLSEEGLYPVVLIGDNPALQQMARQYRHLFVAADSAEALAYRYQEQGRITASRKAVPERYRCRGAG